MCGEGDVDQSPGIFAMQDITHRRTPSLRVSDLNTLVGSLLHQMHLMPLT